MKRNKKRLNQYQQTNSMLIMYVYLYLAASKETLERKRQSGPFSRAVQCVSVCVAIYMNISLFLDFACALAYYFIIKNTQTDYARIGIYSGLHVPEIIRNASISVIGIRVHRNVDTFQQTLRILNALLVFNIFLSIPLHLF